MRSSWVPILCHSPTIGRSGFRAEIGLGDVLRQATGSQTACLPRSCWNLRGLRELEEHARFSPARLSGLLIKNGRVMLKRSLENRRVRLAS